MQRDSAQIYNWGSTSYYSNDDPLNKGQVASRMSYMQIPCMPDVYGNLFPCICIPNFDGSVQPYGNIAAALFANLT